MTLLCFRPINGFPSLTGSLSASSLILNPAQTPLGMLK
jgi:hypothetical protein